MIDTTRSPRRFSSGRRTARGTALLACLVALALTADASSAAAQTINACARPKRGNLRQVPSPAECSPREIPVSWNAAGVPGPAGPQGPAGPAGPQGPAGPAGSADAWSLSGTEGTVAGDDFLGTLDDEPFEIHVYDRRIVRYEPGNTSDTTTGFTLQGPNIIGGYASNAISSGAQGVTIAGGGARQLQIIGGGPHQGETEITDLPNVATGSFAAIGGGVNNEAGSYGTVAGGTSNTAGFHATVGGGSGNEASGNNAVIAGGSNNVASGTYSNQAIGGGAENIANGYSSTIPGGFHNVTTGQYSFAAGYYATAAHNGSFVWSDFGSNTSFSSLAANEFAVRASGGVRLATSNDGSTGAQLPAGSGSWTSLSDRNVKTDFAPVDARATLEKIAAMPLSTWSYKAQEGGIRHLGPMAQDFYAAFGVGEDERHISTVDASGVALAGIQGLYRTLQERDALLAADHARQAQEIATLKAEVATLRTQVEEVGMLKARLDALEASDGLLRTAAR